MDVCQVKSSIRIYNYFLSKRRCHTGYRHKWSSKVCNYELAQRIIISIPTHHTKSSHSVHCLIQSGVPLESNMSLKASQLITPNRAIACIVQSGRASLMRETCFYKHPKLLHYTAPSSELYNLVGRL